MKKIGTFLWIFVVMLTTFFGFNLRYINDQNNQSVVIFSDFNQVLGLEEVLKKDFMDILKEQKEAGINSTLISKEELLRNSDNLRKVNIEPILNISYGDIQEYEDIIKQFKIKYLRFSKNKILGYPDEIERTAKMINDNNLIFIVEEKTSQIGIVDTKGLNELMDKTDYAINRMCKLSENQLKKTNNRDLFYKLVRSVIDRNIRFVYIKESNNPKFTTMQNYKETNEAVRNFSSFIKRMKYDPNGTIVKLNNQRLNLLYYFLVTLGLALTCVVYLKRLLKLDKKKSFFYYIMMMIFIMSISKLWEIELILALVASVVYSSLASLLVLKRSSTNDKRVLLKSVATFFGINLLGGYTVVSCLNSLNYTMGLEVFRGIKVAFLLPLIIYTISFIILYEIKLKDIVDYIKKKSKFAIALTLIGAFLIIAVYILRSGNFKILGAGIIELRIREFLEYNLGVRPRTKEFLIGYPAIMLLIHFKEVKNKILKFVLGIGITIGSISAINSFCHVFTAINVSIIRSANGLILGLLLGKIIIILINNVSVRAFLQNNRLVKKIISLYNDC